MRRQGQKEFLGHLEYLSLRVLQKFRRKPPVQSPHEVQTGIAVLANELMLRGHDQFPLLAG